MARSNPRYQCSSCQHQNTRNQLRGSNGVCIHCKTAYPHKGWMGGQAASLAQMISLPKTYEEQIERMGIALGLTPSDIVRTAILLKMSEWEDRSDQIKAVKDDVLIAKLGMST